MAGHHSPSIKVDFARKPGWNQRGHRHPPGVPAYEPWMLTSKNIEVLPVPRELSAETSMACVSSISSLN